MKESSKNYQYQKKQNSLFQAIIEQSDQAVFVLSSQALVLYLNKAAESLLGYRRNEIFEKKISFIIEPISQNVIREYFRASDKDRQYDLEDIILKKKNGGTINFKCAISPVTGNNNLIVGVSLIGRESPSQGNQIKEKIGNNNSNQNTHLQLSTIIEYLPDPTFAVDKDRKVIAWNRELTIFSGIQKSSVIGKTNYSYGKAFYGDRRPVIIDLIWEDIQDKLAPYYDYINRKQDMIFAETDIYLSPGNRKVHILIKAVPIYDDNGEIIGAIETLRNVSDWEQMGIKLLQAQKMETIAQLSAGVAHEVRNPLNSIIALVEVLNQELDINKENKVFIDQINIQVERLANLMNDLLNLGIISKKEEFSLISLKDVCISAISLWNDNPGSVDYNVELVSLDDEDIIVFVDNARFQQVIINLLDNASNHSEKGSRIIVELLKSSNNKAIIHVIDEGSGIREEYVQKIFEPFFTLRHKGTGLGLSIVDNILKNHGGSINVRNNQGLPGCTFEIILPLAEERNSQ